MLELVVEVLEDEARNNIHGTATSLPPVLLYEVELPGWSLEEVPEVELPGAVELPELLDEVPPGLVALPVLDAELLSDRTAKSIRPDIGLIMTSLIVPSSEPELLLTCAPVSWLARNSWRPIRSARCAHPDWLLEEPVVSLEVVGSVVDPEVPDDDP